VGFETHQTVPPLSLRSIPRHGLIITGAIADATAQGAFG
jgi:hypothetical protein